MCSIPPSSPKDSVRACKHAGSGHTSEVAVTFANPVPGVLHPLGWARPAGNRDFVVTRDCAGHRLAGQGCALDIGNGRCDGKVLAAKAGRVQSRDDVQGIIRIDHADGSRTGYAHMRPLLVKVGQQVAQGQQIGSVSDAHDPAITNFSGCHLHFAIQLSATGPEVDPWPLLQKLPDTALPLGEPMLRFKAEGWKVKAAGAGLYDSPNGTRMRTITGGILLSSIGETMDNVWRAVAVGPDTQRELAYVKRAELDPLTPGGDPAFDNGVWSLLLSRKAPVGDATDNKIRGARTAVDGAAQAIAAAQRSLA